jgi:lipopolysaccharide export system protein LptC
LATAYPVEAGRGAAFSASSHGETERIYRTALRHSRHVRWLRFGVLTGIAGIMVALVVANYMPPIGGLRLPGEIGKLVIKGTKITMQQPKLTGFTNDSRPYEFTADAAAQDITKPDFVELQHLHARVQMEDKSTVEMTAPAGTYDMKSEMLTLNDDIALVSTTGYAARLTEAQVDMHKGNIVSDKPVWVKLLNGFLNAKHLEIVDNGALLRFSGGVELTLQPEKDSSKASEKATTQ